MSYSLEWKKEARKDLEKLETKEKHRIIQKLDFFIEHPDRTKNIKPIEKFGCLRYRIGNFRIFLQKNEKKEKIEILAIEKRQTAYR